ncbi:odorant receptor [Triplophysa rosa]|uniref:Odorant receptor n=1 Tax=Triplophysa rosa TaxID=992332 RepID=A0A9W7WSU6_TRIRA|nr:odorant receptor [Triplophysa rosa]
MNSTMLQYSSAENYAVIFTKNFIIVLLGTIINCINGIFVFTFFRSSTFYNDPRYILYIHLVINDMLMVFITVVLFVMAYAWPNVPVPFCILLLITASATHKNTPLTLAGMAIERYIAICKPLHHAQICTVRRTYILISLIWGVGVIPALAELINKCMNGLYSSVVWLILVFTYFRVLVAAKRANTDKSSVKRAQSTILLHGIQLLLCMLSYITPFIDRIYIPLLPAHQSVMVFFNYLLTNLVPRLLSPLIYGFRDKHFYKHMKGLFVCRFLIVKVESTKQ